MNDSEYLISRGWRRIGSMRNGYGVTNYWDHPNHQPERHGAFTTTNALVHQRDCEKVECGCIRNEAAPSEPREEER